MARPLVIADDHFAIWDAVIAWLTKVGGFEVVAQVSDGVQALQACITHRPQVLLVDISMPGLNGLQVIGGLRRASSQPLIVVYTANEEPEMAAECIVEGAIGYVLKSSPRQILLEALETVCQKQALYIDPVIRKEVENLLCQNQPTEIQPQTNPVLTQREIEIMQMLALGSGKTTEIAEQLCVSRHTVNNHLNSIFRKLEVTTRTEAVRVARQLGIIQV
jgi:DNA-binding NarL/FixJ family response regulator